MATPYPITVQQEQEILSTYQQTSNVNEVVRKLQIARKPVERILKRNNVTIVAPWVSRSKFTLEVEREIMARYKQGEGAYPLAREYGCEPITIRNMRARHGVETMPHGNRRFFSQQERDEMLLLWNEGKAVHFIAARISASQGCVRVTLGELGVAFQKRIPKGNKAPNWKGGRPACSGGYYYVAIDEDDPLSAMRNRYNYVLEHRLVIARHLGRPLTSKETVHHINGDGKDNRIENLQLRSGKHGKGVVLRCANCGSKNIIPSPL